MRGNATPGIASVVLFTRTMIQGKGKVQHLSFTWAGYLRVNSTYAEQCSPTQHTAFR